MLRSAFILVTLLAAVACDRPEEAEPAATRPVAIWRPDSAASTSDSTASEPALVERPAVAGGGAEPPEAPLAAGGAGGANRPAEQAVAGGGGAASDRPPTRDTPSAAEAILLRAERAYDDVRTLQASFIQDLSVPLLASTQRSRGELFHRKPDRFLMRFSDPAGDVVVADGRYLWLYYPSSDPRQVVRTSMGQAGRLDLQREFLSDPTERFDATLDGSESVAGRPASVLTLLPRTESPYRRVRIWIDDEDALARRFEITENNDAVRTVELRDLRVNRTLADELFSFTPPAGAEVFDQ